MKNPVALYLKYLVIVSIALTSYSCASFNEAYSDRICWNANTAIPIQCDQVFMPFRCPGDLKFRRNELTTTKNNIKIMTTDGHLSPKVGELFSHHGSIPIFVESGSPWITLRDDLTQILKALGYVVSADSDAETVILADITLLDVRSDPGGWFDLKGTTKAIASFKLTMNDNNGEELWSDDFYGEHQIKVSYFLLSDAEKTLGQAYCNALKSFAQKAQTAEFDSYIR